MIPISSQSPTLPSHNSLNYELLSLTAICGEVPCAGSSRLTASESYRKKVVTSLTHDKLLRIFSSHHLRGYRLGVRTKRLLLQQEPERFAFYLSGCSDTNAIKSEVPRRIRLHRIAQTYVTMLNERLYRLLREVDSQTLQMLFLKSLGYTAKEIEQRIGMPESMVHNRISRLRKKYKKDL